MKLPSFIFSLIIFFAVCVNVNAATKKKDEHGKVLNISQSISLPEDGYIQAFTASLGEGAVNKNGALVVSKDGALDPSLYITQIPKVTISTPTEQSVILSNATSIQAAQINNLIKQLKSMMIDKGAIQTNFFYNQLIKVKGSDSKKAIVWNVVIDALGNPRYSSPKIVNDTPEYVYVAYTPLKLDNALPNNIPPYQNAGTVEFNIMNMNFTKQRTSTYTNVNGIFDEPQLQTKPYALPYPVGCSVDAATGEMECNEDYLLSCMISKDSYSDCPATSMKDVKTLINENGTEGAYVDYVRAIAPVYDSVATGTFDEDGEEIFNEIARVNINVTSRSWIRGKRVFFIANAGGAKFNMTANIGFQLQVRSDRYFVDPNGNYNLVDTIITESQSPTSTVSKTIAVPKTKRCTDFYFNVIDPFLTNNYYDYRNDTVNFLPVEKYYYVAPLTCF